MNDETAQETRGKLHTFVTNRAQHNRVSANQKKFLHFHRVVLNQNFASIFISFSQWTFFRVFG